VKRLSTKWFNKWSSKVNLSRQDLLETIENLEPGLSAADLGGNLFKVRVRRKHSGKRSGFRTIIVYKSKDKAIFIYGFGKNEKDSLDKSELHNLKKLGSDLLSLNEQQEELAISKKVLFDLEDQR
jgi:hypothetical protein